MDEEGEMDELNEMSLLLKGLGGGDEEEIQGFLTGAERHLCGCIFCCNTCRPGASKMSKHTVSI